MDKKSRIISITLSIILASIIFIFIFGFECLNPFYDNFLLIAGDGAQTYIGNMAFRNSKWTLPIGSLDNVCYSQRISIIYIDSVPLLGLVQKILNPILPKVFQCVGIYSIFCFMFTAAIAAMILSKYTKRIFLCVLSSVFFVLTNVMLVRTFGHTALGSQYIILLALCSIIFYEKINTLKKFLIYWCFLAFLSISVHMYFWPMCTIILCGFLICDYLHTKNIKRVFVILFFYIVSTIFTLLFWGAYDSGGIINFDFNISELTRFSSDVNTFFNPLHYSMFIKGINVPDGAYEGCGYLGFGAIIIVLIAFFVINIKDLKLHIKKVVPLVIIFIIAFIVALSPYVTFNNKLILKINYPAFFIRMWQHFRSTGRMIWICLYIILITSLVTIFKKIKSKTIVSVIIICAVILQVVDFYPMINFRRISGFNNDFIFDNPVWEDIVEENNINWLMFSEHLMSNKNFLVQISKFAYLNNCSCSFSHFSHPINYGEVESKIKETLYSKDTVLDDAIYFFDKSESAFLNYPLNYYCIDNLIIGLKNKLPEYEEYIIPNYYSFDLIEIYSDERYMSNVDNSIKITPEVYNVSKGNYQMVIKGKELGNITHDIFGNNIFDVSIENSDSEIVYSIFLDDEADFLGVCIVIPENSLNNLESITIDKVS